MPFSISALPVVCWITPYRRFKRYLFMGQLGKFSRGINRQVVPKELCWAPLSAQWCNLIVCYWNQMAWVVFTQCGVDCYGSWDVMEAWLRDAG